MRKKSEEMREEYSFKGARRGVVVPPEPGKTRITIRIDTDILDWFRNQVTEAGGGNYQTLINAVLRRHIERAEEPTEKTLRRVIREELRRAGLERGFTHVEAGPLVRSSYHAEEQFEESCHG